MSSKSDRDNRSNQMNPNNSAYESSRGGSANSGDDDDSTGVNSNLGYWKPPQPIRPVVFDRTFYIAAVTFEGSFILAHFVVRAIKGHAMIARSMEDRVTTILGDTSELGVAYWRCASGWERGCFKWYEPNIKQSELQAAERWMKPDEFAKAHAWFNKSRSVAVNCESWFDWRKIEESTYLGVITQELPLTFSRHDYVNLDFNPITKKMAMALEDPDIRAMRNRS